MKRFLFALLALGSLGFTVAAQSLSAQEATPAGGSDILPLVWELTEFVDPVRGAEEVGTPANYTVQFLPDGTFLLRTDCNVGSGSYTIEGSSIELSDIATTLVGCPEGSRGDRFVEELLQVSSFVINQEGASDQLVLALMADGGFLNFAPSLTGVVWEWQRFEGGDGSVVAPDNPSFYTLEFFPDGSLTARLDCNQGAGTYSTDGAMIELMVASTLIGCSEGSLGAEFGGYLAEANTYVIRDGQLALSLPLDSGIVFFNPYVVLDEATPEAESAG